MLKNKLLGIRLQLGYKKQKDFAAFLEIKVSQYNRYENNNEQPNLETIYKISKKLGIQINDIIYEELL